MIKTTQAALAVLLCAPLVFGAFSGPVSAQQAAPSGGLVLNADQKAKADARQTQFKKDLAALGADPKLTPAQKQAQAQTLYQALDKDMMAILTPTERANVLKQRQINAKFQADAKALQADKALTPAQKNDKYMKITEEARNASAALLPPSERAAAMKRNALLEQAQTLNKQLIESETPAQSQKLSAVALSTRTSMQAVIADKTLSDTAKTAKINVLRQSALSQDLALLNARQKTLYTRIQALVSPAPTR